MSASRNAAFATMWDSLRAADENHLPENLEMVHRHLEEWTGETLLEITCVSFSCPNHLPLTSGQYYAYSSKQYAHHQCHVIDYRTLEVRRENFQCQDTGGYAWYCAVCRRTRLGDDAVLNNVVRAPIGGAAI